jgi:hypothetical protein
MTNITDIEISAIDKAIDDWFVQSFNGGALARATDAYNEVHAAKEKLKTKISSLFTPEPSSSPSASA